MKNYKKLARKVLRKLVYQLELYARVIKYKETLGCVSSGFKK